MTSIVGSPFFHNLARRYLSEEERPGGPENRLFIRKAFEY